MSTLSEFAGRFSRPQTAILSHAATAGLLVLLAVQTARLGWALAVPLGPVGAPIAPEPAPVAAVDLAALDRFDPFFRTVSAPVADPATSGQMRLFGVRTGAFGSAIIAGADGRQLAVAIGGEVSPGIFLKAVAPDHVVLSVNGRATSLFFPAPGTATAAVYAPPPPVAAALPTASLNPSGQASGVSLAPGGGADPALLAQAGLQPGDKVISVGGGDAGQAQVQFERGGEVRSATLRIPQS